MNDKRFERQIAFFGMEGQTKLRAARVVIVGLGGVGSFVAPELGLLGVGEIALVEGEELETSNRNRHLCARASDPIPGTHKCDAAERMILEIDPSIEVRKVPTGLLTVAGLEAVKNADYV